MTIRRNQGAEAHVRRLWRHRGTTLPTPRRGPRQQLDLDEILAAGIAIADADGLSAVSTRAIAARFDKTAMALYPYVGTKEHLLALMQDQASAMPIWESPSTSLTDALRAWALALFDVYLTHPWLTQRPWSQATQGPNEQDWLERLLRIFSEWNVSPQLSPLRGHDAVCNRSRHGRNRCRIPAYRRAGDGRVAHARGGDHETGP